MKEVSNHIFEGGRHVLIEAQGPEGSGSRSFRSRFSPAAIASEDFKEHQPDRVDQPGPFGVAAGAVGGHPYRCPAHALLMKCQLRHVAGHAQIGNPRVGRPVASE